MRLSLQSSVSCTFNLLSAFLDCALQVSGILIDYRSQSGCAQS